MTASGDGSPKRGDEPRAVLVAEDVEESAVEYGVELLAKISQPKGVRDEESRCQTAIFSLSLCVADRLWNGINAGRVQAPRGRHQGMLASTASDIENASHQQTLIS